MSVRASMESAELPLIYLTLEIFTCRILFHQYPTASKACAKQMACHNMPAGFRTIISVFLALGTWRTTYDQKDYLGRAKLTKLLGSLDRAHERRGTFPQDDIL